jgi:hypothetical protein
MGHNLYLVEWPSQYRNYKDWYIYDSMVVCAANTTAALSWHPSGDLLEERWYDPMDPDWVALEGVACLQVTHLGAVRLVPCGVTPNKANALSPAIPSRVYCEMPNALVSQQHTDV